MTPRNLRHRLEKNAKLLVIVQKYLPKVDSRFADDKGTYGHLLLHCSPANAPFDQLQKLGQELESKGYRFTKSSNAWLGQTVYKGIREEQPDVIMEVETQVNRLAIAEGANNQSEFSFKEKA